MFADTNESGYMWTGPDEIASKIDVINQQRMDVISAWARGNVEPLFVRELQAPVV